MEENNLELQKLVRGHVETIGKWYKFFAVMGIIGIALMALLAIALFVKDLAGGSEWAKLLDGSGTISGPVDGCIYLVYAGLCVPAVIYLLRAAKVAKSAVMFNDNESMADFLLYAKKLWNYCGIVTCVLLGLCVLLVAFGSVAVMVHLFL